MKIASLDLGSNTFLMLIAEVVDQKIIQVYRDELRVTRLAEGVHDSGRLAATALMRAEECFKDYAEIIAGEKPDKVIAMATSAARDASNGEELFSLGNRYGIPIRIIPGAKEAEISFSGATFEFPDPRGLLTIDVGGGSTEVVYMDNDSQIQGFSLNVGSVRLTEHLVKQQPIADATLSEIESYVKNQWTKAQPGTFQNLKKVVAVAGTPTTLAAVMQVVPYSAEKVHGYQISIQDLRAWRDKLAQMTVEERRLLPGMDPKRADVIVTGATILIAVMELVEAKELMVSDKGVRYGIALMAERGDC